MLALSFMLPVFTQKMAAYDFQAGDYFYDIVSLPDLTCKIAAGDAKYAGEIIVPASVSFNGRTLAVTGVGASAFANCDQLTKVTLPSSVRFIEASAFAYSSLSSVKLPEGLETIGDEAFKACQSLTDITLPSTLVTLGNSAFHYTSLKVVEIPALVKEIPFQCFYNIMTLDKVILHEGIESIEQDAFSFTTLKEINLPESLTKIASRAFYVCHQLARIELPESLESIGESAFERCYEIKSVTLPDNLETLPRYTFRDCTALKNVVVGKMTATIDDEAFLGCRIDNVTVGEKLRKINSKTFPGMKTLVIADGSDMILLENMNKYALTRCVIGRPFKVYYPGILGYGDTLWNSDALTEVSVCGGNTSVPEGSFDGCANLRTLTLGDNIQVIEKSNFEEIPLTTVNAKAMTPASLPQGFSNSTYINAVLYVPFGAMATYQTAEGWKNFWNIQESDFSSIESVSVDNDGEIRIAGGRIEISGDVKDVEIYDTCGRTVYRGTKSAIPLLNSGIYLIKADSKVYKVKL